MELELESSLHAAEPALSSAAGSGNPLTLATSTAAATSSL